MKLLSMLAKTPKALLGRALIYICFEDYLIFCHDFINDLLLFQRYSEVAQWLKKLTSWLQIDPQNVHKGAHSRLSMPQWVLQSTFPCVQHKLDSVGRKKEK